MLDSRHDGFDEQARFVDTLCGLVSWLDRIAKLARIAADDPAIHRESELVDVLLGVLSVRRSLGMALVPTAEPPTAAVAEADLSERKEQVSWLR